MQVEIFDKWLGEAVQAMDALDQPRRTRKSYL